MAELALPTVEVRASFLTAMREFAAEGRGGHEDNSMIGRDLRDWDRRWETSAGFAAYVTELRAQAKEETPRPAGFVPQTTWWWVQGSDFLGRIALRHRLTDQLLQEGGHIGYDVRPIARRRGHATAMLRAVLPIARAMGIDSALLTCDEDNIASRRVIEACGGLLEDQRHGTLRYWVPTDAS